MTQDLKILVLCCDMGEWPCATTMLVEAAVGHYTSTLFNVVPWLPSNDGSAT